MARGTLRAITFVVLGALALAYAVILLFAPVGFGGVGQVWWCAPIGVFGALVANATGAGGGVVFVPVFNVLREGGALDIAPGGVVGTSFLIQCFGMSMGALTWFNRLYSQASGHELDLPRGEKLRLMGVVLAGGLPSLFVAQRVLDVSPDAVLLWFKGFSIVLGSALLISAVFFHTAKSPKGRVLLVDLAVLGALGVVGGVVTALFSVGVGEGVALYLLVRGYPLRATVASAVMISAVTVIVGAPYHILNTALAWEVIVLAAPGVALGGFLARRVVYGLGERRLKIAASLWIVGSSVYLLLG